MLFERGGPRDPRSSKYKEEAGAGEVILTLAWVEEGIYGGPAFDGSHEQMQESAWNGEEGVVSWRSHVTRRCSALIANLDEASVCLSLLGRMWRLLSPSIYIYP